jgi:two-component system chemotaxis sensor kinase CheA
LTLAIIPGLIVSLDATAGTTKEQRFVVPQANLLELVRLEDVDDLKLIENLHGTPVFHHRGRLLPLVYLSRVLSHNTNSALTNSIRQGVNIVVLQAEGCQMGLVVDQIRDTQEIVVKPLGRQLKGLICYVGATIMGDGRPALILDVTGLARLAGLAGQSGAGAPMALTEASYATAQTNSQSDPQMMLLFRAGRFERLAVPLALVARLEEINARTIERAAGSTVLNYRGEILPLVRLGSMLERSGLDLPIEGMVQVIVFADGDRRVGVMVERIEDIVNEAIVMKRSSVVRGLLGSAILGGKITDLLDLDAVAEAATESSLPTTMSHAGAMLATYRGFSTEAVQ